MNNSFEGYVTVQFQPRECNLKFGDMIFQDREKKYACIIYCVDQSDSFYYGLELSEEGVGLTNGNLGDHLSIIQIGSEERNFWNPHLWKYRRCVNLGACRWLYGVNFLSADNLQFLKTGDFDSISAGTKENLKNLFSGLDNESYQVGSNWDDRIRILIHSGWNWDHWRAESADSISAAETRVDSILKEYQISPWIRDQRYSPDLSYINKIEIFRGVEKVWEKHLVKGGGDDYFAQNGLSYDE